MLQKFLTLALISIRYVYCKKSITVFGILRLVPQKRDSKQRNPWTIIPLWPKLPTPHATVQNNSIIGVWGLLAFHWFGVLLPSGCHLLFFISSLHQFQWRFWSGLWSMCLGLKDRRLPKRVGTSLGMKNTTPFPPNYDNFEIKGLSGKHMGKEITVPY